MATVEQTGSDYQLSTLRDGRTLSYGEYGDPAGTPAFYFHGHPGSRLEARLAHAHAAELGLRIIAPDRPGYGGSTLQPGRTILDWPSDVAELADALSLSQFAIMGGSGGGPYALACGYALPGRVTKVGVISGVGPRNVPHATDGMRWGNRIGFGIGARFPFVGRLIMKSMARQALRDPQGTVDAVAKAMSGKDAETVRRPEVRQVLADVIVEAFRQGHEGSAWDLVLLGRPWGFDLRDVTVPVLLWQGEADVLVPPSMGRYQAEQLPNCTARFFPGEGHLLVVDRMPEILEALVNAPVPAAGASS